MPNIGKVKGRIVTFVVDSADPGSDPDMVPLSGTVSFQLNVPKVLDATATPAPLIIASTPFIAVLDSSGYVSTPDVTGLTAAYPDIYMLANDDPDLNPLGTTYTVSYNVRLGNISINIPSHSIFVPTGGTVDLADFIPPDNAPAIGTAQAEAAAARSEAALMEALLTFVESSDIRHIVVLTQAEFDAMTPPRPSDTLYFKI